MSAGSARAALLEEYRVVPVGTAARPDPSAKLHHDLRGLTELARRICGTELAVVNLIDADHQHALAAQGFEGGLCGRADSMCHVVFQDGVTVVVPDAAADQWFRDNPFVNGRFDTIRFYASSPLIAPGGQAIGALCVADRAVGELTKDQALALATLAVHTVDLLELHRRTRQLNEAVDELRCSNAALAEFAGRVSHDLQAPLNSIVGFTEILSHSRTLVNDADARVYFDRIEDAAGRMHRMIRDLLRYAVAGTGPELGDVDLGPLIEDVLVDLDSRIQSSGARVHCQVGRIRGDPGQLRSLLANLLDNAMKYRRRDRPCRISVVSGPDREGRLIRVIDNGLGVPAQERARILQPLTRLERDWGTPGTGIGLATAQRIAQAHGGELEIDETPGGGATITLRLRPDRLP